ncbi:hypothetical protein [Pandoraea sp. NPDC087047]|uniref:hypothetical protein n=1 Tax=Pandoraea sp. NPDC087047 TaxID=3364390 RepID=UPI0037F84517
MTVSFTSPPALPTTITQVSNPPVSGANSHVRIAMPAAPEALALGCWDEFRISIETHRGARNAALVGHVLNVLAKTAALGVAIASMKDDWQSYADIPLHTVAAATQIANLILAVSKYRFGPEDRITGADIRDTNVFQSVGEWTGVDVLKNYGMLISTVVTNGPLVFGAIHNGIAPLLKTLHIPVPSWLQGAAGAEHVGTAIADGAATASVYAQRYVIADIIAGSERRAAADIVVAMQTQKDYAVLDDECSYVHIEPIPAMEYTMEAGKMVQKALVTEAAQPVPTRDTADVESLASSADSEYFDTADDIELLSSIGPGDAIAEAPNIKATQDTVVVSIEPVAGEQFDVGSLRTTEPDADSDADLHYYDALNSIEALISSGGATRV